MASKMADKIRKTNSFLVLLLTSLLIMSFLQPCESVYQKHIGNTSELIKQSMSDMITDSEQRVDEIEWIKQVNVNTAPYEVGYIIQVIMDKYRKMVDRYRSCRGVYSQHSIAELVIYLEEIEHGYWQLDHLTSQHQRQDFGKPLNETIMANAPWTIKLLMLKDMDTSSSNNMISPRRVGMEALIERKSGDEVTTIVPEVPSEDNDENNMRLKLFRLMYETVRDSDLKVKRAELIRQHYANSSAFEVGYLMGEVQEKFDIINEFSSTLEKFYDVWKPIEHINAYEQIANYAIQVNHLIDLVRTIGKDPRYL